MPEKSENRPTVEDVDPRAMAVDATPDEVRMHGNPDESETAQLGDGAVQPVDEDAEEEHLRTENRSASDAGEAG